MIMHLDHASQSDAADLLAWRNHPATRAQSRQAGEISWDAHSAWLDRMLADPTCLFLVAWQGGHRVGVVRFNRDDLNDWWEISIAIAPACQGQGVGRRVLALGIAKLRQYHPDARVLAAVRPGNAASERLFQGAGFTTVPSDEECAHYLLEA